MCLSKSISLESLPETSCQRQPISLFLFLFAFVSIYLFTIFLFVSSVIRLSFYYVSFSLFCLLFFDSLPIYHSLSSVYIAYYQARFGIFVLSLKVLSCSPSLLLTPFDFLSSFFSFLCLYLIFRLCNLSLYSLHIFPLPFSSNFLSATFFNSIPFLFLLSSRI